MTHALDKYWTLKVALKLEFKRQQKCNIRTEWIVGEIKEV